MSGYCLSLSVPFEALGTFETCLDDFKGAISWGLADRRGQVLLELYLAEAPARPALAAAVAMAAALAGIEAPDWRLEALPAVDWVADLVVFRRER